MRLLFVHERFGALAGAEANLCLTAAELKLRGHVVGLVHGSSTGRDEVHWQEVFSHRWSLGAAPLSVVVSRAVEALDPELVFLHNVADVELIEALLARGLPQVRMVHDHHLFCMRGCKYHYLSREICTRAFSSYCVFPCGAFVARDRRGPLPFRWVSYTAKKRELQLHRRFERLIVASSYMKEELVRNGFEPGRVEVHPPVPCDVEATFRPSFSPDNRVVYAGQLVRGKGVDVLLESLAQVKSPFICDILGDGTHRPACEKLSRKLGLDDRVCFHGFVPQDQIRRTYRDASLAVMSSVWPEPFGAVGLEAMRCGLPVVAFDAGGIREWLIDGVNGFLVPWMDRKAFAARVEILLQDKMLARQMGERGREFVTQHFGFSDYINGLERMFGDVLEETRQRAAA